MQRKASGRGLLRVKTGCFPCRLVKKKCDEVLPTCRRCQSAGKLCRWPSEGDLVDLRLLPRNQKRKHSANNSSSTNNLGEDRSGPASMPGISLLASPGTSNQSPISERREPASQVLDLVSIDSGLVQTTIARSIETLISRHFAFGYYDLVLIPGCSEDLFGGWLAELCQHAETCAPLYSSLLACAASHLYMMNGTASMRQLGMTYYATATRQLLAWLNNKKCAQNYDSLLNAIIFMTIHGCQGIGTFADIPGHMGAASGIIQQILESEDRPRRPLDAILVEAVLFHDFHAATGLWSTQDGPQYGFDALLWSRAERHMHEFFGGNRKPTDSPVLGVPPALLRIGIKLRHLHRNPGSLSSRELEKVQFEGLYWQNTRFPHGESTCRDVISYQDADVDECHEDVTTLYILAVSFLLTHVSDDGSIQGAPDLFDTWQLKECLTILQRHEVEQKWRQNYMVNWPVYTFGFFTTDTRSQSIIRSDLLKRWNATKMGQSKRFLEDLEEIWANAAVTGVVHNSRPDDFFGLPYRSS